MANYLQGTNISLIANYTDSNGLPINAGISGVTVDVYHFNSSTKFFDLVSGTMTQDVDSPNRFNYFYSISGNAAVTNHIVEYSAIFSGNEIQLVDNFGVLPATSSFPTTGISIPGSVEVSGSVVNISGSGINNVSITAALLTGTNTVVAGAVSNSGGAYSLYLDSNNYFLSFMAQGYKVNQLSKTVPTGVSDFNFGSTTLIQSGGGSIVISDQYLRGQKSGDTSGPPLVNARVSLYAKGQAANDIADALSVAYTNISGIFTMNASAGQHVLLIQGEGDNNRYFETAYDIDIDEQWSDTLPTNFRYLGTSQFNYLNS